MKCVCPMGGDRTCPGDCPLAVWASLPPTDRKAQRKSVAEQLYRKNMTMEQIATQLGVSHPTIVRDLKGFVHGEQTSRPKGGRPKGSGNGADPKPVRAKPHKPRPPEHHAAAAKALDEGKTRTQVAAETGLSEHQVQLSREREIGRREMLAELLDAAAAKHFSEKGELRIDDAIRIHRARLDREYEQRRREDVRRDIEAANDATRAENKRLREENVSLHRILAQRGVFTKTQFRQMQVLCHPDNSASEQLRAELSQVLVDNEIRLVKG
jgi:hypothetical protein